MSAGVSPTTQEDRPPWPYPRWIAHRGAGKLAPENTLAAFRLGAQHGFRMFECDVKLSADGVPFLMHDATLARTTRAPAALNAGGVAGAHPWSVLSQLDAGSWHSRAYAGEPLPTLDNIAQFCLRNGHCLNIEIKPTPGMEERTGQVVAAHAERLWKGAAIAPLLTSFQPDALRAAQNRSAAARLHRERRMGRAAPDRPGHRRDHHRPGRPVCTRSRLRPRAMAGRRPYFRQPPACHHSLLAVAKVRAAYASILPSRPNNTNANASARDPATKLKAHWCQKATERFERVIRSRLAAVSSTATPNAGAKKFSRCRMKSNVPMGSRGAPKKEEAQRAFRTLTKSIL